MSDDRDPNEELDYYLHAAWHDRVGGVESNRETDALDLLSDLVSNGWRLVPPADVKAPAEVQRLQSVIVDLQTELGMAEAERRDGEKEQG